jgi:hypothetical protein
MTTPDATTMHAELIDHGWRVGLDGRWRSAHPDDARFTIKSLSAAWAIHTAHTQPDGDRATFDLDGSPNPRPLDFVCTTNQTDGGG